MKHPSLSVYLAGLLAGSAVGVLSFFYSTLQTRALTPEASKDTLQSEYKGLVAMFQFNLMVKDRKTDKVVGFTVFCSLKDPLPKGDKKLDEFAIGKKVTVQGKSTAMGNGQVTLTNCIIVREGDKGGAKKGSTKP